MNKIGEEKFTETGARVRIVGFGENAVPIVQYYYVVEIGEYGEGEFDYQEGHVEVYRGRLFDAKPSPDDDGQLARLKDERASLEEKIEELRRKFYEDKERYERDIKEAEKLNPAVSHILKFFNPTFEYYVVLDSSPTIYKKGDRQLSCEGDRGTTEGRRDLRLISLVGNEKDGLKWQIAGYKDGSGTRQEMNFFETEDEAKAFVCNEYKRLYEKDKTHEWHAFRYFECARQHGFPVEVELSERYRNKKIESKRKDVTAAEEVLARAQRALAEVP